MDKLRTAPTVNYQAPGPKPKDETVQKLPTDQLNITYPAPGANNITIPFVAGGTINTMPDGGTVTVQLTIGTQPPVTIPSAGPVTVQVTGTDVLSWSYDFTNSPPEGNQFTALPPPNTPMTLVITATVGGVPSQLVIPFTYLPPAALVLDTVASMSNQSGVTLTGTVTNATSLSVTAKGGAPTDITGKFYYSDTFADGTYTVVFDADSLLRNNAGNNEQSISFSIDTTPPVISSAVLNSANTAITGAASDAISGVQSITVTIDNDPTVFLVTVTPVSGPTPVPLDGLGATPVPVKPAAPSGSQVTFEFDLSTLPKALGSGFHVALFYATDNVGNKTTSPYTCLFNLP
jgi:hypothetical protein